jgi:hypothetical protein
MYGLPKDFDPTFFVNQRLDHITFAEYTLYFSFDDKISITVNSSFQHLFEVAEQNEPVQKMPLAESKLMQLIGHHVTQAHGEFEGTLTLVFDNGHILRIFDDDPHYECYSINDGNREIYV